jgi:hypothetical protein
MFSCFTIGLGGVGGAGGGALDCFSTLSDGAAAAGSNESALSTGGSGFGVSTTADTGGARVLNLGTCCEDISSSICVRSFPGKTLESSVNTWSNRLSSWSDQAGKHDISTHSRSKSKHQGQQRRAGRHEGDALAVMLALRAKAAHFLDSARRLLSFIISSQKSLLFCCDRSSRTCTTYFPGSRSISSMTWSDQKRSCEDEPMHASSPRLYRRKSNAHSDGPSSSANARVLLRQRTTMDGLASAIVNVSAFAICQHISTLVLIVAARTGNVAKIPGVWPGAAVDGQPVRAHDPRCVQQSRSCEQHESIQKVDIWMNDEQGANGNGVSCAAYIPSGTCRRFRTDAQLREVRPAILSSILWTHHSSAPSIPCLPMDCEPSQTSSLLSVSMNLHRLHSLWLTLHLDRVGHAISVSCED